MKKVCQHCGNTFESHGNQKYCSIKCQREVMTSLCYDAIKKRNAIGRQVKHQSYLYYAFQFKCAMCGWRLPDENLCKSGCEMHHIKQVSKGGSNDPKNLILLCPNCHKLAHEGFLTEEELSKHTFTKEQAVKIWEKETFDRICRAMDLIDY